MSVLREILPAIPLFADLPAPLLDRLADSMRIQTVERNQALFHQGDPAALAYIVRSGRLRLVQHSADGRDVTMANFVPGDVIGLVMILTGEPYPGTAEALEDSELLTIASAPMWELLTAHAPLGMRIVKLLAERLYEAHNRIRELSAERVQQRVARSLLRLVEKVGVLEAKDRIRLDIRLSRQDLAQMNGTTLETISRTLTVWENEQIIESHREQIIILKPHALVRIADDLPL